MFDSPGGNTPADVSWMPAHTAIGEVGHRRLGNGAVLTVVDRRGNAAADLHAKAAVEEHRVPATVRRRLAQQEKDVEAMARWVAAVTVHANSWGDANLRDSESLPAARDRRSQRQQERRRRPARPVIAPELGGHDFRRTHGMVRRAWQCIVCHCTTNNPVRLSHQHCSGSAVCRWARQSAALADRGRGMGEGHTLLRNGTVV